MRIFRIQRSSPHVLKIILFFAFFFLWFYIKVTRYSSSGENLIDWTAIRNRRHSIRFNNDQDRGGDVGDVRHPRELRVCRPLIITVVRSVGCRKSLRVYKTWLFAPCQPRQLPCNSDRNNCTVLSPPAETWRDELGSRNPAFRGYSRERDSRGRSSSHFIHRTRGSNCTSHLPRTIIISIYFFWTYCVVVARVVNQRLPGLVEGRVSVLEFRTSAASGPVVLGRILRR